MATFPEETLALGKNPGKSLQGEEKRQSGFI